MEAESKTLTLEDLIANGWPDWVQALFPGLVILYRPNKPKPRKKKIGTQQVGVKMVGNTEVPVFKNIYGDFKKGKTKQQNNYSYASVYAGSADDYGTIRRFMRHHGYSQLIGIVYATERENELHKDTWRYRVFKWKTVWELHGWRQLDDLEWKAVCEKIDVEFPTKATGQTKLF